MNNFADFTGFSSSGPASSVPPPSMVPLSSNVSSQPPPLTGSDLQFADFGSFTQPKQVWKQRTLYNYSLLRLPGLPIYKSS